MTGIQALGGTIFGFSLLALVAGGGDPSARMAVIPFKCAGIGMMCYGGKYFRGSESNSDSAQVERAADMYHAGTYPVDHDERARVQAYFAELDRRRAAANN